MQTRWRQTRLTSARDEYSAALSRPTGLMSSQLWRSVFAYRALVASTKLREEKGNICIKRAKDRERTLRLRRLAGKPCEGCNFVHFHTSCYSRNKPSDFNNRFSLINP